MTTWRYSPERRTSRISCTSRSRISDLLGVEPYVLRFWETEFPGACNRRNPAPARLYRPQDVELLLRIKHLLYEKRYTIEGARQSLESKAGA